MTMNHALLKSKTAQYAKDHEGYLAFAAFMKSVFDRARRRIAPLAIVDARAKSKASYAEKVVRKQDKYKDPLYGATDLCGVRVITQTAQERELFCDYIRRNFIIDRRNSVDVRTRLKENEFGYLSVHYVVQIRDEDKSIEGVRVPAKVKRGEKSGFKAEVQVRTLLEHAWANTLHDRLYKVDIQPPAILRREAAALAAIMEAADARFASLAQGVDDYLGNYAAYLNRREMKEEVEILKAARSSLSSDDLDSRADLTLRLGRLARLSGDLKTAIAELDSYSKEAVHSRDHINLELGHALCLQFQNDVKNRGFARGQKLLRFVAEAEQKEREPALASQRIMRAEAAQLLAWSMTRIGGKEEEARDCYQKAVALDPRNPYHLAAYLEYEVFSRRDRSFIEVMRTTVEEAIATCHAHVAVGIEIPRAHFTACRLLILLDDIHGALRACLKAVREALAPDSTVPANVFDDEIEFLARINRDQPLPSGQTTVWRLLKLAQALKRAAPGRRPELKELATTGAKTLRDSGKDSALIVVGGAAGMTALDVRNYAGILESALQDFEGIVFSGGTKCGIPGLVGEVAAKLKQKRRKKFFLVGCVPSRLKKTKDSLLDERYDLQLKTNGDTLSELEPLQTWIDALHAGIQPSRIRVLGMNGGAIAAFEYRLALALGVRLNVIADSGREADALFADMDWATDANLIRLPKDVLDRETLHALVNMGKSIFTPEELERLGELVHRNYLANEIYSDVDPVRQKWEKLREDFKESNRQQIAYAAEILASENYVLEKAEGEPVPPEFHGGEVERMAKLEHGRWTAQRLCAGWKFGQKKDAERKISPYVCGWEELPGGIKKFETEAINNYAKILAQAGYQIVKQISK